MKKSLITTGALLVASITAACADDMAVMHLRACIQVQLAGKGEGLSDRLSSLCLLPFWATMQTQGWTQDEIVAAFKTIANEEMKKSKYGIWTPSP